MSPDEPAPQHRAPPAPTAAYGWVVRVVTYEQDHRVFADAALTDEEGAVLVARGSAHLDEVETAAGTRAAANLAAFRAVRRLAEEGLRSAHETPDALRARCRRPTVPGASAS